MFFQVFLEMAGQIGSECFPNATNQTLCSLRICTDSFPPKSVQITLYSILMTFSLVGNLLVVVVFYRKRLPRTAVHYFIVSMGISDLMTPSIYLPWVISRAYHEDLWFVDGVLGNILCKLVRVSWSLSTYVSMLSMIGIAADRFHAVLFPMKTALFSPKRRRLIIASTWIAAVALRAHFLYGAKLVPHGTGLKCDILWEPASHTMNMLRINWILLLCLTCVSAIISTVLYSRIIIILYRQKNNLVYANEVVKHRAKENRQVTCMLVIIVVAFYIVWIPYHIAYGIIYLIPTIKIQCLYYWFCDELPLLYPVVNPIVYYIFNENYRQGFRELLYLLCCSFSCINKCKECLQPSIPPQDEINVHNAEQVNMAKIYIELHQQ